MTLNRPPSHLRPRSGTTQPRRARRGAITALAVIMMLGLVGIMALAVDFGRLDNLRADLQTAADAAAHAGAIELVDTLGHVPANAAVVASQYANSNPAMQAPVTVVSAQCGIWDDGTRYFGPATPPGCSTNAHAVRVTVSRPSSLLFMTAFINFFAPGWIPPTVQATATAAYLPATCISAWDTCNVYLVKTP